MTNSQLAVDAKADLDRLPRRRRHRRRRRLRDRPARPLRRRRADQRQPAARQRAGPALQVTQSGLNNISNTMSSMRDVLVKLSDSNVQGNDRTNYQQQYKSHAGQHADLYPGRQLQRQDADRRHRRQQRDLRPRRRCPQRNAVATYGIATFSGSALYRLDRFTSTQLSGASTVAALITATGDLHQPAELGRQAAEHGRQLDQLRQQPGHLQQRQDRRAEQRARLAGRRRPGEGIGAAAALQIRQQLGTQALSIANQAPQTLLSLFK